MTFLALFVYIFSAGFFQSDSIVADSLMKKSLNPTLSTASRIELLNKLSTEYLHKNGRLSVVYARQALYLARQSNNALAGLIARNNLGDALREQGDFEGAFEQYFEALESSNATGAAREKVKSLMGIGTLLQAQENYPKSLSYFLKALPVARQLNDEKLLARVLHQVGNAYNYNRNYHEALNYYEQALLFKKKLNDRVGIGESYNNIGFVYKSQGNYSKALSYYQRAFLELKQMQDSVKVDLPAVLDNIGDVCFLMKQYDKALSYYQQSLKEAEAFGSRQRLKEVYWGLSETYFKLRDFNQSFLYQKKYAALQDTLFKLQNNSRITEVEAKYELREKERQIELLKKEWEINNLKQQSQFQELELRERRLINYLLFGGLVLVVVLTTVFYQRYRDRRLTNQLLKNQNQTIQEQNERLQVANERLKESETYLLELNATKDKFFSIISHDLKSPLNSLTGFLQILDLQIDAFSPEELKGLAKDMNRSVKNLLELLDNLLQWSRTQTNSIEYRPEKLALKELIESNISLVKAQAANKKIDLSVTDKTDVQVYADKNMLNSVLRNLISNALKFTNFGGFVRVDGKMNGRQVEVSVQDNGVGMSENAKSRLFRLDTYHTTAGTANEKGNGLGLILCKEFIEKNGGSIRVESQEGKGTTFYFTLPLSQA